MSKSLNVVAEGAYTFGNYSITNENGEWLILPIKPTHGKSTWLEGAIRCANRDDAFRIANIFTGEDLVNQNMREMFVLVASEKKDQRENPS